MKEFFNNTVTLNLLLGISYFLLASLGFQWGALTSHATLLWPPSGLAVFGCIVFGHRGLPGLLLGAIISSQSISFSNVANNTFSSFLIAGVTGGASILQAFIIAQLSEKYYLRDFRVATPSALYFTLVVLTCCTIAPSIGNITLWQTGIISLAEALQN